MRINRLRHLLAAEGMIGWPLLRRNSALRQTGDLASKEERETAILDLMNEISVPGAEKTPGPISERIPGHSQAILSLQRGLYKVECHIEFNANWDSTFVRFKGFAPTPGGILSEEGSVKEIRTISSSPVVLSGLVDQALTLLEKENQPLDPKDLQRFAKGVKVPPGFTLEQKGWGLMTDLMGHIFKPNEKHSYHMVYVGSEGRIRIIVNVEFNFYKKIEVSGHINFLNKGKWLSFSKKGSHDSFHAETAVEAARVILVQVKKAEKKISAS